MFGQLSMLNCSDRSEVFCWAANLATLDPAWLCHWILPAECGGATSVRRHGMGEDWPAPERIEADDEVSEDQMVLTEVA
eukprot:2108110-Amphidinium_carterae.1